MQKKIACGLTVLGIGLGMTLLAQDRPNAQEGVSTGPASRQLMAEHEVILRVLGAAQSETDHVRRGFTLDDNRLRDILDFLEIFTDRCHYAKEEQYYFPAAAVYGGRRTAGLLDELQIEHVYARSILDEIEFLRGGGGNVTPLLTERLSTYVDLLRRHIRKENEQLYQKASTFLPPSEERALLIGFDRIDRTEAVEFGEDFHERYRQLAEKLDHWPGRL